MHAIAGVKRGATLAVVAMLSALLLCGCNARRSQQYVQQGETYLLIGNVDAAISSFSEAARLNPDNAAAQLGLARGYWIKKDAGKALASYDRALAIEPHLDKAYLEATRVCLATGDSKGAEAMATRYEAADPVAGGILRAYVYRETDRAAGAIDLLTKLEDQAPKSVDVRVNLASAYMKAGQPAKAEQVLNEVLSTLDGSSLSAQMLLVEVYQAEGKSKDLEKQLRALAAARPDDENLKLALARCLVANREFDEAQDIVKPILDKTPESPWANFVLGCCLVNQGNYPDAVKALSIAFGALPQEASIARMLALAQGGGKGESADEKAPPAAASGEQSASGPTWQSLWADARLHTLLKQRDSFKAQDPDLPEVLVLSAIFTQDVALARHLGAALPGGSPVKAYLDALLSAKPEALKSALDAWSESSPERKILRANAEGFALAISGARAQALDTFSKCLLAHPDNGVALYNIASMYQSAGMLHFAIGTLKQLIARHGANQDARQQLFDVMLQAGLLDDARQLAESTYATSPGEPYASLMLARVYRESGETDLAEEVLKRGIERGAAPALLGVALSEVQLYAEKTDAARATLKSVADSDEYKPEVALLTAFCDAARGRWDAVLNDCEAHKGARYPVAFRLLHVSALLRAGKVKEASGPLLDADGNPITGPDTNVLLQAFGLLTGKVAPDDEHLAAALKDKPAELAAFAYAMACREARMSRTAVSVLADLDKQLQAKSKLVALLMSSLARSNGMENRVELARHYTGEYPAMAAAWLGLAEVEHALGNADAEQAALEKAVDVQPGDADAWLRYAQFLDARGDYGKLLAVYRKLAALLPNDPYVANNLAYCIVVTGGDAAEALKLAESASNRVRRNPEVLHTLGLAQIKTGNLDEGAKNLSAALDMRPGDPTLLLDEGKALIARNNAERGKRYIQLALHYATQLGLDFPRRAEAEEILADAKPGGSEK